MRLDLIGEVMHVDHRRLDAITGEAVEAMIDQRAAGDLYQRLRDRPRQRQHARAQTRGEHHRGFRQSLFLRGRAKRARQMRLEPAPQRLQRGMGEIARQRLFDARQQF